MEAENRESKDYQICSRCIMDTTAKGIVFNKSGICNFCELHEKLENVYPLNPDGDKKFENIIDNIKKQGRGNKYDCIVGLSGGRDSIYTLWLVKQLGLNPLAINFDDGFRKPVAVQNMVNAVEKLNVDMRTISPELNEVIDLKKAFLRSSTPDIDQEYDLGLAATLFGQAAKENIKNVIIGFSFRTEGIGPLSWYYIDGKYLKSVHKIFGKEPLKKWKPTDPGFNLDIKQIFYYSFIKNIKTTYILNHVNYIRKDAEKIITEQLGWVNPGAHYADDLFKSLVARLLRVKFNIDRRLYNYSALVRSGQMDRAIALEKTRVVNTIEDSQIIDSCLEKLEMSKEEFEEILAQPPKSFRDYSTNYSMIKKLRPLIWALTYFNFLPAATYDKYFNCG